MILTVFELITMLAVLGLGFVLGRIWEIRQQEILQRKLGHRYPTRTKSNSSFMGWAITAFN